MGDLFMDNEKLQELMLQQFNKMDRQFSKIFDRLDRLESNQREFTVNQKKLETSQQELTINQQNFESNQQKFAADQQMLVDKQKKMAENQQEFAANLQKLESNQQKFLSSLTRLEFRVENEIIKKIGALFDAREAQQDINRRIILSLERIEAKVDILQMETVHIRHKNQKSV